MISKVLLKLGRALPLGCVLVVAFAAQVDAQQKAETRLPSAQSILDRHIAAVGGRDAIKAHSSVKATGSISVPANGLSGTVEIFAARPNKSLSKLTIAGIGEVSEGYDGTVAWSSTPMTGPMLATGEELTQKAFDANFDRALGVAARYDAVKTLERTTFEGRPVYKIALTRKGDGGDDIELYDVETGLKAGSIIERKSPMGTIAITFAWSDYKKFGDLLQASVLKQTASGVQIVTTFTSIDYDNVDPSVFELPVQIKALIK
jgi:hypothetical protein